MPHAPARRLRSVSRQASETCRKRPSYAQTHTVPGGGHEPQRKSRVSGRKRSARSMCSAVKSMGPGVKTPCTAAGEAMPVWCPGDLFQRAYAYYAGRPECCPSRHGCPASLPVKLMPPEIDLAFILSRLAVIYAQAHGSDRKDACA